MCKSSLHFDLELNVEGLLGVTVDKKEIFLVNINESFQTAAHKEQLEMQARGSLAGQKRSASDVIEIKEEEEDMPSCARKRRVRRRSRDSSGNNIGTDSLY